MKFREISAVPISSIHQGEVLYGFIMFYSVLSPQLEKQLAETERVKDLAACNSATGMSELYDVFFGRLGCDCMI